MFTLANRVRSIRDQLTTKIMKGNMLLFQMGIQYVQCTFLNIWLKFSKKNMETLTTIVYMISFHSASVSNLFFTFSETHLLLWGPQKCSYLFFHTQPAMITKQTPKRNTWVNTHSKSSNFCLLSYEIIILWTFTQ